MISINVIMKNIMVLLNDIYENETIHLYSHHN